MRAIGHELLDPRLEVAARDVDRALDVALLELVLLADVDERDVAAVGLAAASVGWTSSICLLGLRDQVGAARPRFVSVSVGSITSESIARPRRSRAVGASRAPGASGAGAGPAPRSAGGC